MCADALGTNTAVLCPSCKAGLLHWMDGLFRPCYTAEAGTLAGTRGSWCPVAITKLLSNERTVLVSVQSVMLPCHIIPQPCCAADRLRFFVRDLRIVQVLVHGLIASGVHGELLIVVEDRAKRETGR